jgi:SMC interacting uncharacterized protein involved in chromosome segregation
MRIFWKSVGTIVTFGVLAGTVWVFFNIQTTVDWFRLRGYEPTPAISQLATQAAFSEEGRKLFYVHDPELLDKTNFVGKCSETEETIVLGCYISLDKIYVFDVDDERLEGIEEVTAAHEMLHAVYDRLTTSEREKLDKLLLDYFNSSSDARLQRSIDNYRKKDPSVVPNELHSILGTEVRNLPEELERHYANYFSDRNIVIVLSEAYEAEFTKLEDQIVAFDEQLEVLSASIEEQENQISQLGSALTVEQSQLEALRSDTQAYNSAVPSFNQKVRDYNSQLVQLKAEINQFNEIVQKRNDIALEEQELVKSIDTRSLPQEIQ